MTCIPSLQSWCIIPSKKDVYKFTKAHQYLQRNPSAAKRVINHDRSFYRHLTFFRIRIISHRNEPTSSFTEDVLSNTSDSENGLISASDIINIIKQWDLVDVLDIQEENKGVDSNSFIVIFKTAISAHVMTKLRNFPDLIQKNVTISIETIDPIPENARVPLVYIQGIGPDVSDVAIRHFFRDMSFILKIERYQKENIFFHIIKLPSVKNAINLSKQVNEGKLNRNNFISVDGNISSTSYNSSQSLIVASHQYKSTITLCFFITSDEKTSLKPEDVHAEVSKFGEIDILFTRVNNNITEFYIKMNSLSDAKLACGIMNNRMFDNVTLKAIFISPQYFNDLYSELKQEQPSLLESNNFTNHVQISQPQFQLLEDSEIQLPLIQDPQHQFSPKNQQKFNSPQNEIDILQNFEVHQVQGNENNGDQLSIGNLQSHENEVDHQNFKYIQNLGNKDDQNKKIQENSFFEIPNTSKNEKNRQIEEDVLQNE